MELISNTEFLFIVLMLILMLMLWMTFVTKLTFFNFKKDILSVRVADICYSEYSETKVSYQMIEAIEGDEDMKILSDSSYKSSTAPDTNEDEISQYFWHKQNGNIDIAKYLGGRLSQVVLEYNIKVNPNLWMDIPADIPIKILEEQAQMMYVYVAETMAKEMSPDSIICQIILSSLNDGISDSIPNFYTKMADCRAYTLYKLCGSRRDTSNRSRYIGETYAQMVGLKDDEALCVIGGNLYNSLKTKCLDIFNSIKYTIL